MRKFLSACIFLFFCGTILAQEAPKKVYKDAEMFFYDSSYMQALPLYRHLLQLDTGNANLNYKTGVCMLHHPLERKNCISLLERATREVDPNYQTQNFKKKKAPVTAYLMLGDAYHLNYRFDDAIAMYGKFKGILSESDLANLADVDHRIELCMNAKELVAAPVDFKVKNLGPNINSPFPDYSAVLSADQNTIVFTSRRNVTTGGKKDESGNYFEDIFISQKENDEWLPARNIGLPVNTDGHEATIGLSVDGSQLFIYKDDGGNGNIYSTSLKGNIWSEPVKLPNTINTKFWEPSVTLSSDGNTLYFVSDTLGGFGGRDIYRCVKLPNGKWSHALNLGPRINTKYDEDGPFIQPDDKTLYFSSRGHKSMGGFDVFVSTLTDTGWSTPRNIGYPVNTTDDDIFFVPTPDNRHAYYSSYRADGLGEKDIYEVELPGQKELPISVFSGVISSIFGGVPEGTVINVTDNITGDLVGTYYPNTSTGKYVFILPPGKNYNITYEAEGFAFQSFNLDVKDTSSYQLLQRPVELMPIKVGTKIILKNVFFESGKSVLKPESKVELDKLKNLLMKMPKLVAEIGGHCDAQGSDELNLKLSEKRAAAVVQYLVDAGIAPERLRSYGYGESQPIAANKNHDGSWNRAGMAMNRRFEFKVIGLNGPLDVVEPIKVPDNLKEKKKK
ncbi:MAG: PD40 domain-containing protein [Bacteroidia bacterium]|nr:PD40 domain-containing protein [Bacteroidia bacterium]